jgi:hypothetical protein
MLCICGDGVLQKVTLNPIDSHKSMYYTVYCKVWQYFWKSALRVSLRVMLDLALGYEKPTSKVSRFGILDYQEGYQTLKPWYPCGYLKKNQISDPVNKLACH